MSSRNNLNEVAEDKTPPVRLPSMLLLYWSFRGKKKKKIFFSSVNVKKVRNGGMMHWEKKNMIN